MEGKLYACKIMRTSDDEMEMKIKNEFKLLKSL
jgi:hypothetical protein